MKCLSWKDIIVAGLIFTSPIALTQEANVDNEIDLQGIKLSQLEPIPSLETIEPNADGQDSAYTVEQLNLHNMNVLHEDRISLSLAMALTQAANVENEIEPQGIKLSQLEPIPSLKTIKPKADLDSQFTSTFTFKQLNWNSNNVLRGDRATTSFYLPVPIQWQFKEAKLNLVISHSPLLLPISNLNLELNDKPVSSLALTQENTNSTPWTIPLPIDAFKQDWISLNLIGFLRVSDDPCKDYDNPSNWALISPDSTLTLSYKINAFKPNLANLPYPFIDKNLLSSASSLLVLPSDPSFSELVAALKIARAFGAQLGLNQMNLTAKLANTVSEGEKAKNNLIFVGKSEQFSYLDANFTKNAIINDQAKNGLPSDLGIIRLLVSPWNPIRGLLTITGNSDLAVIKAANSFATPQSRLLLQGQSVLVTENSLPKTFNEQVVNTAPISLKDLGYQDQTVLGLGHNSLSYTFTLPNNQVPKNIILNTLLSHSVFDYKDRSMLTVSVNDVKQASLILVPLNEQDSRWKVQISGDALRPGKNTLSYSFDLHVPQEGCATRYYYQAWGVIHGETTLQASFNEELPHITLNQFPMTVGKGTLVILPQKFTGLKIGELINFFLKLGQSLGVESQAIEVASSNEVTEDKLREVNTIIIGTAENNPWVAKVMNNAPIKIQQGKISVASQNANLAISALESLGVVELIDSPWNKNHNTLLITGTDNNAVSQAMNLLVDNQVKSTLRGNVATIDQQGSIATYETRLDVQNEAKSSANSSTPSLNKIGGFASYAYQNIVYIVIIIFLIIVIILAIVGFFLRRRTN
ncbi:Cellulose synthase regulatory subunit [Legionella beliardensis]|uniref:Cyclic di-GMP-binding protein n=1 Tax=Legionella beliardensis TaxID=91822 RepID=A0A378HZM6_9GAMM|nr:cellulose biosynthesis cyclic di-GMP-binding regulatory protein BcsB [Legionella beliardensis]STX28202.1 Cellulose synthase regulatory subunit [Legionella beliardensis]